MRKTVLGAVFLLSALLVGEIPSARAATATESGGKPAKPLAGQQSAATRAMLAHVDTHLAALKKSLAITPAEQSSWHGFAQVMRGNATGLSAMYQTRAGQLSKMNAVANMESYAAITARQADDINKLTAAFQTLYSSLSPAQQQKADEIFRAEAKRYEARRKP